MGPREQEEQEQQQRPGVALAGLGSEQGTAKVREFNDTPAYGARCHVNGRPALEDAYTVHVSRWGTAHDGGLLLSAVAELETSPLSSSSTKTPRHSCAASCAVDAGGVAAAAAADADAHGAAAAPTSTDGRRRRSAARSASGGLLSNDECSPAADETLAFFGERAGRGTHREEAEGGGAVDERAGNKKTAVPAHP